MEATPPKINIGRQSAQIQASRTRIALREQSLSEEAKSVHFFAYMPALLLAVFKDILDFTGIGSLPAIGTAVTIVVSFFIYMCLHAFAPHADSHAGMRRGLIMLSGGGIEAIFLGLNFLPIETLAVLAIYFLDKKPFQNIVNRPLKV
ncbi:MAG: hypothetical protein WDN67_02680 [Candidatus Moraniibacteriota bacterium]